MNTLIQQLQKARQTKGLSQSELGKQCGLPQSHLSKIESGQTDPRLSSLIELARHVDLEPMLIPRTLVPAIKAIISGNGQASSQPAWLPDEE